MARTPEAKIKAELLVFSESSGLDIATAAKKINVKVEKLQAWELGESRPSIAQLRKARKRTSGPWRSSSCQSRRVISIRSATFASFQTRREAAGRQSFVLRFAELQDVAAELYRTLGEEIPKAQHGEPPSDPEQFGEQAESFSASMS